jgi:hypothetical protein
MTLDVSAIRSGESGILLVLDTNEFILGLTHADQSSAILLDLIAVIPGIRVVVPTTVVREATVNLAGFHSKLVSEFSSLVYGYPRFAVVPDDGLSSDLIRKYIGLGLREEDASIGAFTEWVGADFLVSENRHFLRDLEAAAFRVEPADRMVAWLLSHLA